MKVYNHQQIDENYYLRQILALGVDSMIKLLSSSVFITGMNGLGVEIAKNIILSGVKSVTIHDNKNTEINDLGSNFFLTEKSIGNNRAIETFTHLSKLNERVTVSMKTGKLTADLIKNFNCVVIADIFPESEIKQISSFCHQNEIKLIIAETCGLFAYIFTDFGSNFYISNQKGNQFKYLVNNVTQSENSIVTINDRYADLIDLDDGDLITFEDVEGMTELNGKEFVIKIIDKTHFTIGDTRSFSPHSEYASGYVRRINVPKKIEYLEFSEAIKNPSTMQQQFDTTNQSRQVILSFIALQNLLEKSDKNLIEITGDELFECTRKVNSEIQIVDEINEQLIREFARECGSIISPMCSVIGGIVSQEIIKLLISKYTPIHQFFSIDYTKSLPKNTEYKLMNDRYDSYRIVFGNMQHEEMEKLSYLIVGFGSIGSELLKNLALMGFATKNEGQILTIDKGLIKKSDLNRNFLLKNEDIGKMKSDVVKQAVNSINPNVNISSKQLKINDDTDFILSDKFYELFDGICGTIKNEKHENFLNSKCTFYNKPFLVSQTQGMKAVYQTIVPRITNCFENQLKDLFPLLELSGVFNFPKKYDQCCLFGSLTYMQMFEKDPQLICSFFDGLIPKDSKISIDEKSKHHELSIIKKFYIDEKCENFEDCIKWARMKFENLFNFHIQSLIENLPKNVWSHCLIPKSTTFDVNDENHIKFIKSASLLRAKVCQIEPTKIDIIQTAAHEEKGVFNEEDFKNLYADQILQQTKLPKPEKFSKENNYDNDYSNVCFDFIASTVKIYAHIYKIKNIYDVDDDLEIKQYFRKIVPSLITTNSMIAGFVALEMYKIHCIDNDKQLSDFRSGEIDLSVPCFKVKEPEPCKYIECTKNNMKFTLWDKWEIEGNLTVNEFIEKVREKYNVNICMIAYKTFLIYNENLNQNRLNSKIVDIITNDCKNPIIDDKRYLGLDCVCIDDNDVDVEIPIISLVPFPK